MFDVKEKLTILHDDNGTFNDISIPLASYLKMSSTIDYVDAEDFIYVGYHKAIDTLYVDILSGDDNVSTMIGEYYDGNSWIPMVDFIDLTDGFNNSGYIKWSRVEQDTGEVDGIEATWYRFSLGADKIKTVNAINILFADDDDLSAEFPQISHPSFLQEQPNFVKIHSAVRDEIISFLMNKGARKISTTSISEIERVNSWDLLDVYEVRQSAIYLALSKILFNVSDNSEDVWGNKYKFYLSKYQTTINSLFLSIDKDDNGESDTYERLNKVTSTTMSR